ncbi:uncharacterized protein LOC133879477 isoform X2 [Alnus glutinosa]|uniref:uncharacterized protein LOC133879477 isoform X2 n=1 Tax=Alnus glutinosa TaxID=3517 RepID=UPI002D77329D|nr:uncharacterized protein LOC133879477 isoform X2 [Alnus glutinosa]
MEVKDALSEAVLEVLDKDNYVEWSIRVQTYLMAQDLWDTVEATTEPPKQEDDEATFMAWSEKNSMALNVIQKSCRPDTLFEIREISSANVAWNTLAVKYNVPKKTSSAVLQVLEKDNYVEWSVQVKNYLMAHDLWDIIEATTEAPRREDDEAAFRAWSKKNFMALHVIQISCGTDTFSSIKWISTAKNAWDTLAGKYYNVPQTSNSGSNVNQNVDHEVLNKAVRSGNWNAVEVFLKRHPGAAGVKITNLGQTALHVAVGAGHENIVEKLVVKMSEGELAVKNGYGDTALADTIYKGNYRMAVCMLRKNVNLASIKNSADDLPVVMAIYYGHIKLARHLYSLTPEEDLMPEKGIDGATLSCQAIYTGTLDIALDLIERCPRLALAMDKDDHSPLYALASVPFAFPSGNRLVFWKRWIYSGMHIQHARAIKEIRLNINQNVETKRQRDIVRMIGSGIKDLYEMKSIHVQADELLRIMCKEVAISNTEQRKKGSVNVYDAIFYAIKRGIFEFVFEIVKESPDLVWSYDGERVSTIFSAAVLHRQPKIFSLIYGLDVKNVLTYKHDNQKNNILHMAGMPAPSTLANRVAGAALQMQSELQWYKEVESIVHPNTKEAFNDDGICPPELFTKNHKDLMKEGEQWMKDTATSCTVVGALILTIMFAAAITVPGGNDQTGLPMFLKKKVFMLFIISDSLSLFSSSTSVLMFLGVLTSRYAEDDFLKSLPTKMIIGLSTLFFSIATMMIAFSAALLIILRGDTWLVIPAICLASVPVTLFVWMQFPLLVDMSISTYGPGVFDRKKKRWF